ncbi:MAG: VTC domain-containing protein [Deltaproteobacteria bacterium]|nr:VTC domain-containing protein [Deltaproteobacteria bacterium]
MASSFPHNISRTQWGEHEPTETHCDKSSHGDDDIIVVMRTERKYIASLSDGARLAQRAELFALRDPHCGHGPYSVETVYFDTPDRTMLDDKLNGEYDHIKIRARRYDRKSRWFIESKIRRNRTEHKVRYEMRGELDLMTSDSVEAMRVWWAGLRWVKRVDWVAQVRIDFDRLAFVIPGSPSIRLNFDTDLVASFGDERREILSRRVVVEVKAADRWPPFLERELEALGTGAVSFSKYAAAMDSRREWE